MLKETKKQNQKTRATRRGGYKDPFGFTRAVNWDVIEKMDEKTLKELSKILDKVK